MTKVLMTTLRDQMEEEGSQMTLSTPFLKTPLAAMMLALEDSQMIPSTLFLKTPLAAMKVSEDSLAPTVML